MDMTEALSTGQYAVKRLAFIFNMPAAYSVADLVICRSGAMTLAEIAVWGLPSILIPYPHATGDHQTLNAREFVHFSAAIIVPELDMSEKLFPVISELMGDAEKRQSMAQASKKFARPDAANIIAKAIVERIHAL